MRMENWQVWKHCRPTIRPGKNRPERPRPPTKEMIKVTLAPTADHQTMDTPITELVFESKAANHCIAASLVPHQQAQRTPQTVVSIEAADEAWCQRGVLKYPSTAAYGLSPHGQQSHGDLRYSITESFGRCLSQALESLWHDLANMDFRTNHERHASERLRCHGLQTFLIPTSAEGSTTM